MPKIKKHNFIKILIFILLVIIINIALISFIFMITFNKAFIHFSIDRFVSYLFKILPEDKIGVKDLKDDLAKDGEREEDFFDCSSFLFINQIK